MPEDKLTYLDYGFHLDRLESRRRDAGEPFTFGYIGTHIPAKGVDHLIEAFGSLPASPYYASGDASAVWRPRD